MRFFQVFFCQLWVGISFLFVFSAHQQAFAQKTVEERGYAEIIQENSNKLVAMHKTAPIGTNIRVYNPSTGRSITVEVIARLPSTGNNEKVIIKISETAFYSIYPAGDKSKRFGVEISYKL